MSATAEDMLYAQPAVDARLQWLRRDGLEQKIVWVHGPDGSVDCYQGLAHGLPSSTLAIAASSARVMQDMTCSVEALAADYLLLLAEAHIGCPLILGGWSFGGLVGYEMAVQLHARGVAVPLVVLLDSSPGGRSYRPRPYPGRVLSIRAVPAIGDPDSLWRRSCSDLEVLELPTDHYSILQPPVIHPLVRLVWSRTFR